MSVDVLKHPWVVLLQPRSIGLNSFAWCWCTGGSRSVKTLNAGPTRFHARWLQMCISSFLHWKPWWGLTEQRMGLWARSRLRFALLAWFLLGCVFCSRSAWTLCRVAGMRGWQCLDTVCSWHVTWTCCAIPLVWQTSPKWAGPLPTGGSAWTPSCVACLPLSPLSVVAGHFVV